MMKVVFLCCIILGLVFQQTECARDDVIIVVVTEDTIYIIWIREQKRDISNVVGNDNSQVAKFKLIDVDGDGFIDASDWSEDNGDTDQFETLLKNHDKNGDGKLSFSEFAPIKVKIVS